MGKIRKKTTDGNNEGQLSENTLVKHSELLLKKGIHLIFIFSGGSPAFYNYKKKFKQGLSAIEPKGNLETRFMMESDHGFTLLKSQELLVQMIYDWVLKIF